MSKCETRNRIQVKVSRKASAEPISLCLGISNLPRDASELHPWDSRTLSASTCLHRGVVCKHKNPQCLGPVYVVSKPQIRHWLLTISLSTYEYSDMKSKRPTRSSSGCWSCYGQAKEWEQENCDLAVHVGMIECSNAGVFQLNRFEGYWLITVFRVWTLRSKLKTLVNRAELQIYIYTRKRGLGFIWLPTSRLWSPDDCKTAERLLQFLDVRIFALSMQRFPS